MAYDDSLGFLLDAFKGAISKMTPDEQIKFAKLAGLPVDEKFKIHKSKKVTETVTVEDLISKIEKDHRDYFHLTKSS